MYRSQIAELTLLLLLLDTQFNDSDIQHFAILSSAVPHRKMGVYMGMFNLFVVIPQILASAILGLLVRTVFHGQTIYALVLGGVTMIISGVLMMFVKDSKSEKNSYEKPVAGSH